MTVSRKSARPGSRLLLFSAVLCLSAMSLSDASAQARPAIGASNAPLQAGDKVRLRIYRESELSGEFTVAEDGAVVFPKIGRIGVDHMTTDSLTSLLVKQYSISLREPSIEVTPLRRVNVIGSVRSAGFYWAEPTVTVKGALALAGGVTPEGNKNKVELLRGSKREILSLQNGPNLSDSPVQSGDQVSAPERSWMSRNTALVVSGVTGLALIAVTLIRP